MAGASRQNASGRWPLTNLSVKVGLLTVVSATAIAAPNGAPPADSVILSMPKVVTLKECERATCGIWVFDGGHGEGRWPRGQIAALTLQSGPDGSVIIGRKDVAGPSIGLTAQYQGTRKGLRIDNGSVTWRFPTGRQVAGTWSADVDIVDPQTALSRGKTAVAQKNPFDAMRWFVAGAAQGNPEALVDAGIGYVNGLALPADYEKAARLFRAAAEQGSLEAKMALVKLYGEGKVVRPDSDKEDAWVKTATEAQARRQAAAQARLEATPGYRSPLAVLGDIIDKANAAAAARAVYCKENPQICAQEQKREDEMQEYLEERREQLLQENINECAASPMNCGY
jgi:hypothetical protein